MRYSEPDEDFLNRIARHWPKAYESDDQARAWLRAVAPYNRSKVLDLLPEFYDSWDSQRHPKGPDFGRWLAHNLERVRSDEEQVMLDRLEQLARAGRTFRTPSGSTVRITAAGLRKLPDGPFAPWSMLSAQQKRDAIHLAIVQGGQVEPRELESIPWVEFLRRCAQEGACVTTEAASEVERALERLASKERHSGPRGPLNEQVEVKP